MDKTLYLVVTMEPLTDEVFLVMGTQEQIEDHRKRLVEMGGRVLYKGTNGEKARRIQVSQ
jgi:hypothetical protein